MSQQSILILLATVLLVCVTFVFVIDITTEVFKLKFGLRLKWTLLWYGARYIAIVCGVLLALEVLLDKGRL